MELLFWILLIITIVFIVLVLSAVGFFWYILFKSTDDLNESIEKEFENKY